MEYKVGDVVIIRDWDDMASEYGTDRDGDISHSGNYYFSEYRKFCGTSAVVQDIDDSDGSIELLLSSGECEWVGGFAIADVVEDIHENDIVIDITFDDIDIYKEEGVER